MRIPKQITMFLLTSIVAFGQITTVYAQEKATVSMASNTRIEGDTHYVPSSWAEPAIEYIKKLGIVKQHENYPYKSNITRADFCELVYKVYVHQKGDIVSFTDQFIDTDNISILKLATLGIIAGKTTDTFGPEMNITREEAAIVINKLTEKLELNSATNNMRFVDEYKISSWAKDHVNKVAALGILKGNDKNEFSPQDHLTFEQTMVILTNIMGVKKVPRVTINTYYNAPKSINDKEVIILKGTLEGEYIEIVVEGEMINFEYLKLIWNDKTSELVETDQIAYYESITDKTIVIKTYMPDGIPSEKVKWKSTSGKLYEYIIREYNLGEGNEGVSVFNLE